MGKNFELTRRTTLGQLPKAGFTHLQGQCSRCGEIRRKPLSDFGWQGCLMSIGSVEGKAVCGACGERFMKGTFGPWGEHNRYRGPR